MFKEIRPFFTPIFLVDIDLPEGLSEFVLQLRENNPQCANKSNRGGWQSLVYRDVEEFEIMIPVIEQINKHMGRVYRKFGYPTEPTVKDYWFNINGKYSYNLPHSHPGCLMASSLYVKMPKHSGNIIFQRDSIFPDTGFDPKHATEYNIAQYVVEPKEGNAVLFPWHLNHYVDQNLTDEEDQDRITIAFNYA